jgi:hypothetical protein
MHSTIQLVSIKIQYPPPLRRVSTISLLSSDVVGFQLASDITSHTCSDAPIYSER